MMKPSRREGIRLYSPVGGWKETTAMTLTTAQIDRAVGALLATAAEA